MRFDSRRFIHADRLVVVEIALDHAAVFNRDLRAQRVGQTVDHGAMDLLIQAGGFGMVAVDLSDVPTKTVRQVPLNAWFRFRRAVEDTPTILLLLEQEPHAKTCASLVVRLEAGEARWSEASPPVGQALMFTLRNEEPVPVAMPRFSRALPNHPFARLLRGFAVSGDTVRSRIQMPEQRVINIRAGAQQKMAPPHKTDREMFETETIWKTR